MEILSLATQKGVYIYAVKGNWQLNNSIQSKIVAMAFAMAAEIDRDLISQRTTEALQVRKQQGIPLGVELRKLTRRAEERAEAQ